MKRHENLPFDQIAVNGMVYAYIIRAGEEIGSIRGIRTPALPEGYSILTAEQLPFRNRLDIGDISVPLFAAKSVSYRGEAVGLLIGPNPLIVEELASATVVECEGAEPRSDWHAFTSENIAARIDIARAQPQHAAAPADADPDDIFEHRSFLRIEPQPFSFHSGIGALAEWDYDKLKVACPTLWPEHVRSCIARMMDAQVEDIEITQIHMRDSSELYSWFPSLLAARATAAAWALKKPVKLLISISREREFLPYAQGISMHLATRWSRKHRSLLAAACRFAMPIGAYSIFARLLLDRTVRLALDSIPDIPLSVTGFAVATDAIPMGATESISSAALFALVQAHLAQAARAMDIGVIELTQKIFSGRRPAETSEKTSEKEIPAVRIARPLLDRTDFFRKYAAYEQIFKRNPGGKEARLRALSCSFAFQDSQIYMPPAGQRVQIQITLDRNLKTVLESDAAFASDRLKMAIRQQIADTTKTALSHVAIEPLQAPHAGSMPLISSSGLALVGDLVRRAEERIQRLRFREGLPLTVRTFSLSKQIEEGPQKRRTIAHPSIGAAVLEVEYDTLTSSIQHIEMDISVHGGRIISPALARSAIRDSCMDALRGCLSGSSLPRPTINVALIEDEKAVIARPIGGLAYALTLSCFLGVLQQLGESRRLSLPLKPASPAIRAGENA